MKCPTPTIVVPPNQCSDDGDDGDDDGDCATAADVFGILLAVGVLFLFVAYLGGICYNCRAKGKSGLDALPGYESCTRPEYNSVA